MKTKLNRTVPNWVDVTLMVIGLGTFAKAAKESTRDALELAELFGLFIGLMIMWLIFRWVIGWCFGGVRFVLNRNKGKEENL